MRHSTLTAALAALTATAALAANARPNSQHMLDSIMARKQGIEDSGAASSTLESGILAQAMEAIIARYPETKCKYSPYLSQVLDIASSTGLTNTSYAAKRPLDRFSLATAIRNAEEIKGVKVTDQAKRAHDAIDASLALQTRNPDGGLWYYVYPEWSYLDGMVSLLPFMAAQPKPNLTDMLLQVNLLRSHCTQTNTSLLFHGYDWSRKAVWADPQTGASPYVWGRSLGWFLAGLVQTWERLSCTSAERGDLLTLCSDIKNITFQVSSALVQYADKDTGAWWQIVTFPNREGNYLESSSTALFTFSMLKALRIGLLYGSEPDYKGTAERAYKYMADKFVTQTAGGTIGFDKTVSVCSLNSSATYEYYTGQPLVPNSLLGEAAFILASLEMGK